LVITWALVKKSNGSDEEPFLLGDRFARLDDTDVDTETTAFVRPSGAL